MRYVESNNSDKSFKQPLDVLPDDKESSGDERSSMAEKEKREAQRGHQAWIHLEKLKN